MTDIAYQYLVSHMSTLTSTDELNQLLDAILTEKEQKEVANRIKIFSMLQAGSPQREISEHLGVGIATVSRGAKAFRELDVNTLLPDLNKELEIK